MAKGSVRKKGKKWYYRFYVEDESGNRVQKEFPGTESKSETEALLRKAMENYESTQFIAKAQNITLSYSQYLQIINTLKEQESYAVLAVQIAYYFGLRLGEVCA